MSSNRAEALLPIYAGEIFDVGPVGLGVMRAAPAVGAAVLAAAVTVRPIRRHVGRWMFGGVAAFGVATIVFGLSTSLALELGEFESGVTAAWWGIVPAVVIGGGATVAVAVAWSRLFPVLRRLDRFPDPEDRIPG